MRHDECGRFGLGRSAGCKRAGVQLWLLAQSNIAKGHLVNVFVGEQATLILPDQDVPLGVLTLDQVISVALEAGPDGCVYEVKIFNRRIAADGRTMDVVSASRHPVKSAA